MRLRAILIATALTTSGVAFAQDAPAPADPPPNDEKKPAEEESDPTLFEGANPGEEENPNAPKIDLIGKRESAVKKKKAPRPPGYPQEVLYRPLTLAAGMPEASFDYRVNANPFHGSGLIGAKYGITSQIQAGLRYGFGSVTEDGYEPGKTVALDFEYLVADWIAAQLAIPVLADPFAVGVVVGAPMKFTFRDFLRFEIGRDLVVARTNKEFVPRVDDALRTATDVTNDEINMNVSQGEIRLVPSVIYQHNVKIAVEGRFGLILDDFELNSDSPLLLDFGGTYAHSQMLDFGGRIGFADLSTAGDSFGVTIFSRFRI